MMIVPLPEGEVTWDTDSVRRKLIEQSELDKAKPDELLTDGVKKIVEEVWAEGISRMIPHPSGTVFPEYKLGDKAKQICQLFEAGRRKEIEEIIDDTIFEVLEYLRKYTHQLERKNPKADWLDDVWDMIRCVRKEGVDEALKKKYLK